MADPPALRMRRSRAHKAGDHSLCRPGCTRNEGGSTPIEGVPSVADTVRETITAMRLVPGDPRGPVARLALAMAVRFDRGEPVPGLRPALAELSKLAAQVPPVAPITDAEIAAVLGEWEEAS